MIWEGGVERRVENGDMRYRREEAARFQNSGDVDRIMERRERAQRFQVGEDIAVNQDRAGELLATVHDAVPDHADRGDVWDDTGRFVHQ